MPNFTHLHVHTQYSVLDGMSKIPELISTAVELGMNSIAITDHGNMYGIKEFLDCVDKHNSKLSKAIKECKEQLGKDIDEATRTKLESDLADLERKQSEFVPFKPIVGVEAYCARRTRFNKDKDYKVLVKHTGKQIIVDQSGYHLILLAKNKTGYRNLCKIVSASYLEGMYYRPRIDKQLLEQYHEGIIACSACLGGELPQLIMEGKIDEAEDTIRWFKGVFGDDYYVELQRHKAEDPLGDQDVYARQQQVNPILIELARKTGTKIIASNDVHFVKKDHAQAHDALICLNTGAKISDTNRMHYTREEWLKSPEQMLSIFNDLPEAIENTQEIVDKVEPYSIKSGPIMPIFPIPEDFGTVESYRQKFTEQQLYDEFTRNEHGEVVLSAEQGEKKIKTLGGYDRLYRIKLEADYLGKLTWEGAKERYGETLDDETRERIIFELHIMKTMGFPGYFLIVSDYIRAAREELGVIVGPGRGSAAGSVVAYCLKITNIDPLRYDLLFERFLNPDRISLPDIDVDFDDDGRAKVLDWVSAKYGKTHVAHIVIYGTMATKNSIADVARVLGVPLDEVKKIKSYIPEKEFPDGIVDEKGKKPKVSIANCIQYIPELAAYKNGNNEAIKQTLTLASQLEGTVRQVGVHACGVIIGADDLTKFAPLATVKDKDTDEDVIITEYDGHVVEDVGLIKMDFLGLATLSIVKEAIKNIRETHGIDVDIDHIPLDDEKTYQLLSDGKTVAIFQFESAGMQKYLRQLKPNKLEDLIAMNALYRPGPMDKIPQFIKRKQGAEPITYDIPVMERYLSDTYGITVYQEQVMLLSRLLAGFTRGQSDQLRKAMGKKIVAMLEELKPKFIDGGKANGHDEAVLNKIWREWEEFAKYAFNKSHATCYAWLAYQTAYLKANYPAEFMAANLTRCKDDPKKVEVLMTECKQMGINVLPPDINESELNFHVMPSGDIRYGLGAIKGVGEGAVNNIVSERKANGLYKDIFDVLERVNLQSVNKKTFESLAFAGAFDCFADTHREQYFVQNDDGSFAFCDELIRYAQKYQQGSMAHEMSLFGGFEQIEIAKPQLPNPMPWPSRYKLEREKELVGNYLSRHPLDDYKLYYNEVCNVTAEEINSDDKINAYTQKGKVLKIGGIIVDAIERTSQSGKNYGKITIEDYSGKFDIMLFGKDLTDYRKYMTVNNHIIAVGRIVERNQWGNTSAGEIKYTFRLSAIHELNVEGGEKLINSICLSLSNESLDEKFVNLLTDEVRKHQSRNKKKKKDGVIRLRFNVYDMNGDNVELLCPETMSSIDEEFYEFLKSARHNGVLNFKVIAS